MADRTGKERHVRKQRKGRVISKSGDKSIVVLVERRVRHPLYGKVLRRTKRHHTHDEGNVAAVGDIVNIVESRPISKSKRWRLVNVETSRSDAVGASA